MQEFPPFLNGGNFHIYGTTTPRKSIHILNKPRNRDFTHSSHDAFAASPYTYTFSGLNTLKGSTPKYGQSARLRPPVSFMLAGGRFSFFVHAHLKTKAGTPAALSVHAQNKVFYRSVTNSPSVAENAVYAKFEGFTAVCSRTVDS